MEYTSPFAAPSFAWYLPLRSQRYSMGIAWMKMIPQFVLIFNYDKSITFWQLIQMTRNSIEILGFSIQFPFIPMPLQRTNKAAPVLATENSIAGNFIRAVNPFFSRHQFLRQSRICRSLILKPSSLLNRFIKWLLRIKCKCLLYLRLLSVEKNSNPNRPLRPRWNINGWLFFYGTFQSQYFIP